jgi:uncharacterized protein
MAPGQHDYDRLMQALAIVLRPLQRIAIACSGGVDSTVLAVAAARILGASNVFAVTAEAPMVPEDDRQDADDMARIAGIQHLVIHLPDSILSLPPFSDNPPDRCYHCKKIIFNTLFAEARQAGFSVLCDGTNVDDLGDYRPGLQALREMQIISPLAQAGLTKADVRELARNLCPNYATKPAMACLATRIPTYTPITRDAMARIDRAESLLRRHGLTQVRVRDHGDLARVELDPAQMAGGISAELMVTLRDCLQTAGFKYCTIDLYGYRSGSMNPQATKLIQQN